MTHPTEAEVIERMARAVDRYMLCRVGGDTWGIYDTQHAPEDNCWAATGVKGEEHAVDLWRKFNAQAALSAIHELGLVLVPREKSELEKLKDDDYCANCGCNLPIGCKRIFEDDGNSCLLNRRAMLTAAKGE